MSGEQISQWSDDYRIGSKAIDTEHHFLFSMIQYMNYVLGSSDKNRNLIATSLQRFIDYTRMHFRSEEVLMLLCHYEGYGRHHLGHENFIRLAESLLEKARDSETLQALDIVPILQNWLAKHFLEEDVKLQQLIL